MQCCGDFVEAVKLKRAGKWAAAGDGLHEPRQEVGRRPAKVSRMEMRRR